VSEYTAFDQDLGLEQVLKAFAASRCIGIAVCRFKSCPCHLGPDQ
jgi:hypothetical protein